MGKGNSSKKGKEINKVKQQKNSEENKVVIRKDSESSTGSRLQAQMPGKGKGIARRESDLGIIKEYKQITVPR